MHMSDNETQERLNTQHWITAVIINKVSLFKKCNNLCKCKQHKSWCIYCFEVICFNVLIFMRYTCNVYDVLKKVVKIYKNVKIIMWQK